MSERYWDRLRELLQQTASVASELRPTASEQPSAEKGVDGALAYAVQGLSPDAASTVAGKDPVWAEKLKAASITNTVVYGVSMSAATAGVLSWAAGKLAPEKMHVNVCEADVSALDIGVADRLVKVRARLRSLQTRSDKCLRIAAGMDGKRKISPAALERLKLQLEKAEAAERKKDDQRKAAAERQAAAVQARLAREKRREEAAEKKSAKKSSADKKEQEKSARKSFFTSFLNKKKSPQVVRSLTSNLDAEANGTPEKCEDKNDEVIIIPDGCKTVGIAAYKDKSVLPVSLWLTMKIPFDYAAFTAEKLRADQDAKLNVNTTKAHLTFCAERRQNMENQIGRILLQYRRERGPNSDERAPRFIRRRSDVRGRGKTGPIQLLQFDENHRPAFVGTTSRRSALVSGRRPLGKDKEINYEFDSEEEWEEEALDGESLSDVENEKEEDAELRMLYGSDDEEDDDDFLDDENAPEEDDGDDEEGELDAGEIAIAKAHVAANVAAEKDVVMVDKPAVSVKDGVVNVDEISTPEVIEVETVEVSKKRPLSASKPGSVSKKRRRRKHNIQKAQVQIIGITYGGEPSMLDKFPVCGHIGAPTFALYDPAKEEAREREAAAAKQAAKAAKAAPVVRQPAGPKTVLDAAAKFDLATLIFGQSMGRDRVVTEFMHLRKGKQQELPTISEVNRTIVELAVRDKRGSDTRAHFYLRDKDVEAAVRAHLARNGRPKIDFGPLAVPVLAANALRAPGQSQRIVAPQRMSNTLTKNAAEGPVWQKTDLSRKKALLEHDISANTPTSDSARSIQGSPESSSAAIARPAVPLAVAAPKRP